MCLKRKNELSRITGFEIPRFTCDYGLRIAHYGNLIINGYSKIGKNALFYGGCCIGWNGVDSGPNGGVPYQTIGDNVSFGIGSIIIGRLSIGDNSKIGAGAVVTHSFPSNSIIIGFSAKSVDK